MKKEYMNIENIIRLPLLGQGESSYCFQDGETVIKLYYPGYLEEEKSMGIDSEKKLLNARRLFSVEEIETPISVIYDGRTNKLIGTRSKFIKGVNYSQFLSERKTERDYATIIKCHDAFEHILKEASKQNVVLSDFTSCDNIMITNPSEVNQANSFIPKVKLIDYEGIQVKNYPTASVSTSLLSGNDPRCELIFSKKYMEKLGFFTTELNIYSQYVLFFLDLVHANITKIGTQVGSAIMTFDCFFQIIGLDDYDLQNKIWKLFQPNMRNEFLEEDKYTILDKYDIEIIGRAGQLDIKRLVRKK